MKILRMIKIFLASLSLTTLVMVFFVMGFLASHYGKQTFTKLVNTSLNLESVDFQIGSIESFFPLNIRLSTLDFHQNQKPWLEFRDVLLTVKVKEIFLDKSLSGDLHIQKVKLLFIPEFPEDPQSKQEDIKEKKLSQKNLQELLGLNTLFPEGHIELPLDLNVKLKVQTIEINKQVTGQEMDVSFKRADFIYSRDTNILDGQVNVEVNKVGAPLLFSLKLNGSLDNLSAQMRLSSSLFKIQDFQLSTLSFLAHLEGLPLKPKGKMKGTFTHETLTGIFEIPHMVVLENTFHMEKILLKGLGSSLRASLTYDLEQSLLKTQFDLSSKDLSKLGTLLGMPLKGWFHLKGYYEKMPQEQLFKATLKARELQIPDYTIGKIQGEMDFKGNFDVPTLKSSLEISKLKGSLYTFNTAHFKADLQEGKGPLSFKAIGENALIDLSSSFNFTPSVQNFQFQKLLARFDSNEISLVKPFTIRHGEGRLNVSPVFLRFMKDVFKIQGSMDDKTQNLDFKANGNLHLETLSKAFLPPGHTLKGTLGINGYLKGTPKTPDLKGTFNLSQGYYENALMGIILDQVVLKGHFNEKKVALIKGTATDKEKGKLTLTGMYTLESSLKAQNGKKSKGRVKAQLGLQNFQAVSSESLNLLLDKVALQVSGTVEKPVIRGNIFVGDSTFDLSSGTLSDVPELNVVGRQNSSEAETPEQEESETSMDLNVDIHIPKSFLIKGKGLFSRWRGALKATSPKAKPLVSGKITLLKGDAKLLGNQLKMEDSTITFDRHPENIPYLNVKAFVSKKDIKAWLIVLGRATKPDFILESEPPLPQDEILSRLLFNKEASRLSPLEAIQLARYLETLGSLAEATGITDTLSDKLGLDRIGFGETGSGEKALKAEKKLFERVTVELSQGVGAGGTGATVELEVTPKVSLEAEVGTGASSQGLSLNYKWDY